MSLQETTPPLSADVVLEARNISKSFGGHKVLNGISFQVRAKSVVGLIGASGSGKSTLLRCLNFIERPTAGEVHVGGQLFGGKRVGDRILALSDRELSRQRRDMSMVFQRFNLWPHKTALENVTEALTQVLGLDQRSANEKAMAHLERVGLADRAGYYPAMLSGGQQQRVGIARALATDPKVMLFDEPTSALDPELVGTVLKVMADLAREGRTMIVVTHEMSFAREICDHIIFLDAGVIADQGPPKHIFESTTNERTLQFLDRYLRMFSGRSEK